MMNIDWFSKLSEEQEGTLKEIIQLEKEIEESKKNRKGKEEKIKQIEKQVEEKRINLLSLNPHLFYYLLYVKNKASADNLRSSWIKKNSYVDLIENTKKWGLYDFFHENLLYPTINLTLLPSYSFFIQFAFTLEKPYISHGEQEFYIIDNPIRKDKVFGLPYVASSSWKGSLRSALWQVGHKDQDKDIRRIFGNRRATKEQKNLKAGRLHLFPTFFTKKSLEIINPHDRKRKVGKNPILIESVPKDECGLFTLLYVPFDLIGKERGKKIKQVANDIQLLTKGLNAMFSIYGFGAKTSSGYGIAKSDNAEGKIVLRIQGLKPLQIRKLEFEQPDESFKKYLQEDGKVKEKFKGKGEAGLLSNTEYGQMREKLDGGSLSEFKKFRHWYANNGKQWQKYIQDKNKVGPKWPIFTFKNFNKLEERAKEIGSLLKSKEVSK